MLFHCRTNVTIIYIYCRSENHAECLNKKTLKLPALNVCGFRVYIFFLMFIPDKILFVFIFLIHFIYDMFRCLFGILKYLHAELKSLLQFNIVWKVSKFRQDFLLFKFSSQDESWNVQWCQHIENRKTFSTENVKI